ncbi:MAG: helix-turn-helix transcriptional regulator [Erysipelotrichaceae bacterium]|nr:helix-turn-helix transcriptional regulator [Erysipelotrichaceae bacterium]
MNFAEDIKKLRRKLLLSQEDFANELGISYATVNRWETGKSKPTYKNMKLIDEYCKKNSIDFDIANEILEDEND